MWEFGANVWKRQACRKDHKLVLTQLRYQGLSGRPTKALHTPDFLVLPVPLNCAHFSRSVLGFTLWLARPTTGPGTRNYFKKCIAGGGGWICCPMPCPQGDLSAGAA